MELNNTQYHWHVRPCTMDDAEMLIDDLIGMIRTFEAMDDRTRRTDDALRRQMTERVTQRMAMEECVYLVAIDPNTQQRVGMLEASLRSRALHVDVEHYLHVHAIFVNPTYRRKGVAIALGMSIRQWGMARHCVGVEFNVLHANTPAVALSRSLGFQIKSLTMARQLKDN